MMWIVAIPSLFAAASAAALLYALRGRRVDNHPHCRRCGFDLIGRPRGSNVCSECGADLRGRGAVQTGWRETRGRVAGVALPVMLASLAWLGVMGWRARPTDWNRHMPVWWLLRQAEGPEPAAAHAARVELLRRLRQEELSSDHIADVADGVLKRQRDLNKPWPAACGAFMEDAYDDGKLSAERWDRYLRQMTSWSLAASPDSGPGGELVDFTLTWPAFRDGGTGRFAAAVWWNRAFELSGHTVPPNQPTEPVFLINSGRLPGTFRFAFTYPDELRELLTPGLQSVRLPLEVVICDGIRRPPGMFWFSWNSNSPSPKSMTGRFVVELTAAWQLPDPRSNRWIHDRSLRDAVRSAIHVSNVYQSEHPSSRSPMGLTVAIKEPPVNVAFRVLLRTSGGVEYGLGEITCAPGQTVTRDVKTLAIPGRLLAPVDVVLRPDETAAQKTFNPVQFWGREVVIPDQPVTVRP
jgi:hypothetical protein